tara:strand:+ start:335 stop:1240 length:906 start_codon:yes stop_codon:yes gene_type:complete
LNNLSYQQLIGEALNDFSSVIEEKINNILPVPDGPEGKTIEAMRYTALGGGKFIRPYLVRLTSKMFDVPEAHYLQVGAAVEMAHAYSLIHDDLPAMDNDDIRRGKPSCHMEFGEATAILAGDGLLTLAFGLLAEEEVLPDANIRCRLIASLASQAGCAGMIGGQTIDLASENKNVDKVLITQMARMKTGALLSFASAAGGILGEAEKEDISNLETFGFELGLIFQITDDLLDVEGDQLALGKKVRKDAEAGKATFVSALGVNGARSEAHRIADAALAGLNGFGSAADSLRALVKFVLERKK